MGQLMDRQRAVEEAISDYLCNSGSNPSADDISLLFNLVGEARERDLGEDVEWLMSKRAADLHHCKEERSFYARHVTGFPADDRDVLICASGTFAGALFKECFFVGYYCDGGWYFDPYPSDEVRDLCVHWWMELPREEDDSEGSYGDA